MPNKFQIYQTGNSFFSNKEEAISLSSESFFGELKAGKIIYSIYEVIYLLEKGKAELIKGKNNKKESVNKLLSKLGKKHIYYIVFKDLRDKGMIVKEGLKFGTDFRVYIRGQKPGKSHAKYLLHISDNKTKINLNDFAAKSRIAHTTNKSLLLAIVDSQEDVNYYEVQWKNIL
jgi:tRNA-intron endonuclease